MSSSVPAFMTSNVDTGFTPEDPDTRELYREVAAFARQGQPIIIFGPTGAGKEFLARHYYNTLIKTEFYQQNKENWPLKFKEIKDEYSLHYSGESLEIFLKSLRAGVFQSINSATIYPYLAESILFGHEDRAFNDARTSPGLLESIKYGVLFMDEIGDLSRDLQVKLLRAVDTEICEGRRIAGKMDYSLRDIIIISATNQPREKIREDFYYKMGIEVNLKGIDTRPKDVRKSIPHFIRRAIGKRKDYAAVINMFGISGLRDVRRLPDTDEVKNFARELSDQIADEILNRKWPGNFRALRNALEASIFRIEATGNEKIFSQEFRNYLNMYIPQYSTGDLKHSVATEEYSPDIIFPSQDPNLDGLIYEKICQADSLIEMNDAEKKLIAVLLSMTLERGFRRTDMEEQYKRYGNVIKFTSEAHIRSRINRLVALGILTRTGNGKSTRYFLSTDFLEQVIATKDSIFSVPAVNNGWADRSDEINALGKALMTTERVYIQAPPRYGKSVFVTMFCKAREKQLNFYYYHLGENGINQMLKDMADLLKSVNPCLDTQKLMANPVVNIHPYLRTLFKPKEGIKPVLILDNVYYISDPDGIRTIVDLAKKWKEVILILVGDTMDNAFQEDFYEFILGPWGRQA